MSNTIKQIRAQGQTLGVNQIDTLAEGFDEAVQYMCGDWDSILSQTPLSERESTSTAFDDSTYGDGSDMTAVSVYPTDFITIDSNAAPSTTTIENYFGDGDYITDMLYLAPNIGTRVVSDESTNPLITELRGNQFPNCDSDTVVGYLKLYKNMTFSQAIAVLTALYKTLLERPYIFESIQEDDGEETTYADIGKNSALPFTYAFTDENSGTSYSEDVVIKSLYNQNGSAVIQDFSVSNLFLDSDYLPIDGDNYNLNSSVYKYIANNTIDFTVKKTPTMYSSYYDSDNFGSEIVWPAEGDTYKEAISKLANIYKIVIAHLGEISLSRIRH